MKNNRINFDEWAMGIAELCKERSTCLSRKVGAVIIKNKQIISTGYNGAPTGCKHCSDIGYCVRKQMGFKSGEGLEYCRSGHAETNAITQCAKFGTNCEGATLYVTTQPCVFCCINIIQAGIKKVIFKGEYPTELGLKLLKEANVEYVKYNDEDKNNNENYFCGMSKSEYIIWCCETKEQIEEEQPTWNEEQINKYFEAIKLIKENKYNNK